MVVKKIKIHNRDRIDDCPISDGTSINGFRYSDKGVIALWRCVSCKDCETVKPNKGYIECGYKE